MYKDFFGLSDSPFENTLDQRFLFLSEDHSEVLAALLYFIKGHKAFALLCGDVGTGKTMLLSSFYERMPANVSPIIISCPVTGYQEILRYIARHAGVDSNNKTDIELIDNVKQALIEGETAGRQYVLVIDEAHLLSEQCLEHIRLLSNIETPRQKLLQIILVGQYELSHKLNKPEMRQLKQRISINRFLSPLNALETVQYVDFRLQVAGTGFNSCFDDECRHLLYKLTGGVPRLINQICDSAMLICRAEGIAKVNRRVLKKADEALRSDVIFTPKFLREAAKIFKVSWQVKGVTVIGVALLLAVFGTKYYIGKDIPSKGVQSFVKDPINSDNLSAPGQVDTSPKKILTAPKPKAPLIEKEIASSIHIEKIPHLQEDSKNVSAIKLPELNDAGATLEIVPGGASKGLIVEPQDLSAAEHKVTVSYGETLSSIARRYYQGRIDRAMEAILKVNPAIKQKDMIYADQAIMLPELEPAIGWKSKPVAQNKTYFTVQVAAIKASNKKLAEQYALYLKQKGYPSYIIKSNTQKDNPTYKIRMGEFISKADAKKLAMKYRNEEKRGCVVYKSSILFPRLQDAGGQNTDIPEPDNRTNGGQYHDTQLPLNQDNQKQENGVSFIHQPYRFEVLDNMTNDFIPKDNHGN